MEFNLVIEIDENQIAEWLADNPTKTLADFKGEAGNACYLGLDCIDAMMSRLMGLGVGNSYVKRAEKKQFLAQWGEGYHIHEMRNITMAEITEDNGYPQENIFIVEALRVGETADLSDPSGALTIKRIK